MTSRCRLIFFFGISGLIVFWTQIQHYFTVSRFQHYGVAIGLVGLGFILETLVSLRKLDRWACMSYISTGLFFLSMGLVFYTNSWLDTRVSIQTEETERLGSILVISYTGFTIYLAAVWTKWIMEENKSKPVTTTEKLL